MSKEIKVGDIWRCANSKKHWLIFDFRDKVERTICKTRETLLWAVCLDPETEDDIEEGGVSLTSKSFENDTLVYREPVPMTNSVGQPFKVDDPGKQTVFTVEELEHKTLKSLGLTIRQEEGGIYIVTEESSNPESIWLGSCKGLDGCSVSFEVPIYE